MGNTVLEYNTDKVYLYTGKETPEHRPDLHSVTYIDGNTVAHTIHVPASLGFDDPHKIIDAVDAAHEVQQQRRHAIERDGGTITETQAAELTTVFIDALRERAPHREEGGY